jgi:glycerate kinase
VIPRTVLIAIEPLGEGLGAERAGAAIGRGLRAGDPALAVDVCPIEPAAHEDLRELLEVLHFDARMRTARAVVVGTGRLDEGTLAETWTDCLPASAPSAVFEIATRARQAGVPAYAVAAESALSRFGARILDLQVILEARDTRALRRAGETLAGVV